MKPRVWTAAQRDPVKRVVRSSVPGAGKVLWAPGLALLLMLGTAVLGAQSLSPANMPAGTPHAPDEFGTQDYVVTTISAASFTPKSDDNSFYPSYDTNPTQFFRGNRQFSTDEHFYATVSIPAGAVIDFIGLEGYCDAPFVTGVALTQIGRYGGIYPVGSFSCTQHGFDSDYNPAPLGYMWPTNVHTMLVLDVEINVDAIHNGGFSWVEIWWKRTVSPAPATATFNDVPTSDPAFQFVEALAASGITAGCGGGNYCPDAGLTRRQMAVFLSKALGLHWPY